MKLSNVEKKKKNHRFTKNRVDRVSGNTTNFFFGLMMFLSSRPHFATQYLYLIYWIIWKSSCDPVKQWKINKNCSNKLTSVLQWFIRPRSVYMCFRERAQSSMSTCKIKGNQWLKRGLSVLLKCQCLTDTDFLLFGWLDYCIHGDSLNFQCFLSFKSLIFFFIGIELCALSLNVKNFYKI